MQAQKLIGISASLAAPVFALHSAATTLDSTGALSWTIKGKAYTLAALTTEATPTTDAVTGAAFKPVIGGGSVSGAYGNGSVFVLCRDAAKASKVVQGSIVPLGSDGNFVPGNLPQFPEIPDTLAPVGYVVCKAGNTAATAGWIFGTSNFSGVTGITLTVADVALGMPDRPQAS